jgi:hypothetical protein
MFTGNMQSYYKVTIIYKEFVDSRGYVAPVDLAGAVQKSQPDKGE